MRLLVGEFTGGDAGGDAGEQIVLRLGDPLAQESGKVARDLTARRAPFLGRGGRTDHGLGVLLEELVLLVRHTQQLADDQRRDRQGEHVHQVHRGGTGQHVVDQAVHDALHGGPQRLDLLDRERTRHHPAQPGVFGVVHHDEAELALAGLGAGLGRIAGLVDVGADAGVAQQGPLLGVPGHEPGLGAVPQAHLGQRPLALQVLECGRRVEGAAGLPGHRELRDGVRHFVRGTGQGVGHGSPRTWGAPGEVERRAKGSRPR